MNWTLIVQTRQDTKQPNCFCLLSFNLTYLFVQVPLTFWWLAKWWTRLRFSTKTNTTKLPFQLPSKFRQYLKHLGSILSAKNSQNSEKILRIPKCAPIKIFRGKFSEICPASYTKIFCLKISQIFWKNWWVQNFQIFVRKFLRTQFFLDRIEPWYWNVSGIFLSGIRIPTISVFPFYLNLLEG